MAGGAARRRDRPLLSVGPQSPITFTGRCRQVCATAHRPGMTGSMACPEPFDLAILAGFGKALAEVALTEAGVCSAREQRTARSEAASDTVEEFMGGSGNEMHNKAHRQALREDNHGNPPHSQGQLADRSVCGALLLRLLSRSRQCRVRRAADEQRSRLYCDGIRM